MYLENPVIELLTDFILMMNRPEDNGKRVEELAVFFESLHLAFQTLDNYYKGLKELDETEAEKIQRFFLTIINIKLMKMKASLHTFINLLKIQ